MIEVFTVMYGNSVFSSALAVGDESDMDRYFLPILWSLYDFGMKMAVENFQRWGIVLALRAML